MTKKQLRTLLVVQLTCLPKWQRRKAELQKSEDVQLAVDALLDHVFKDMVVIRPSMAMNGMHLQAGEFGRTEPWPLGFGPEDATAQGHNKSS